MYPNTYPTGQRVIVSAFAENPTEAINKGLLLEPQTPPPIDTLHSTDVVIAVRSVLQWVGLIS